MSSESLARWKALKSREQIKRSIADQHDVYTRGPDVPPRAVPVYLPETAMRIASERNEGVQQAAEELVAAFLKQVMHSTTMEYLDCALTGEPRRTWQREPADGPTPAEGPHCHIDILHLDRSARLVRGLDLRP